MALGSQEATFLSEDEHEEGESSMARVSVTGKRTGTKPRKRRTLRRLVISLH
jgi:hypothetical protein